MDSLQISFIFNQCKFYSFENSLSYAKLQLWIFKLGIQCLLMTSSREQAALSWELGNSSLSQDGWVMEHATYGSGHSLKLLKFKKCLENILRNIVGILDSPVWNQRLDFISGGLFHLGIFCDSLNEMSKMAIEGCQLMMWRNLSWLLLNNLQIIHVCMFKTLNSL